MPQVIYTGENHSRPVQNQGRALQAMSQYTQQNQMRKEADLQRSRQDRNMLSQMMQLDPVYATSVALQDKIAGEMDTFQDEMTNIYKELGGNTPTTKDLMKIQQQRAMTMARMQGWKATDNALQQAQQAFAQNPGKFREDWFKEGLDYTQRTGEMPQGGYLFKSVENPFEAFQSYADKFRGSPKTERKWIDSPDGKGGYYENSYVWPQKDAPGFESDTLIGRFANNQDAQYNIQGSFDQLPEADRRQYVEQAGGDEMKAANLWFYQGAQSLAYPAIRSTTSDVRPSVSETKEDRSGIHKRGNDTYSGNYKLFSTQQNIPVVDGTLDNAVVFDRPSANRHPSPLPSNILKLPEGVEVNSSTVDAIPHAADQQKAYWIIDKNSIDKVSFTESAMEAFGKDSFEKGSDGKYKIKEGFESDVMIPTNTGDVLGLLDGWTGGTASEEIAQLPSNKKETLEW